MKGITRGKKSVRAAIGLGAAAGLLFTAPAIADMTRWHPHLRLNTGQDMGINTPWGNSKAPYMHKIDDDTVDNVVWNTTNVFNVGIAGQSWFDKKHSPTTNNQQRLSIHNPTVDDYTGANKITIALYNSNTGDQILDSDSRIDTTPAPSWMSFNTTTDVFEVEVPSLETRTLFASYFLVANKDASFVAKIHSPKTGGGEGAFLARSARWSSIRWRIDNGDHTTDFHAWPNKTYMEYALPSSDDLDGLTSPMLVLPYWIDSDDEAWTKYSAYVHIANVDSVDLDITVEAFELDGTSIKSHTFDDVPAHSKLLFIPSQFLDAGDPEEGYLEASAVQSASTSTVGEILGAVHAFNLALVHFLPGAGWAQNLTGETLTIIDDN